MQVVSLKPAARGVLRGLERQGWRERSPTGVAIRSCYCDTPPSMAATYLRASPDDPSRSGLQGRDELPIGSRRHALERLDRIARRKHGTCKRRLGHPKPLMQ